MLLGGLNMGAVFAPFSEIEFIPVDERCGRSNILLIKDRIEARNENFLNGIGLRTQEERDRWIEDNIPKQEKETDTWRPNIRMVPVLQNRNILPFGVTSRKEFDIDCSDGECDIFDVSNTGNYDWRNKAGDKYRKVYRKWISQIFSHEFKYLVQRYIGLGNFKDIDDRCRDNLWYKNSISRSANRNGTGNYTYNKRENMLMDEECYSDRFGECFHDYQWRYGERLTKYNHGYSLLEWNGICGVLDAIQYMQCGSLHDLSNYEDMEFFLENTIDRLNRNIQLRDAEYRPRSWDVIFNDGYKQVIINDILLFLYNNHIWRMEEGIFSSNIRTDKSVFDLPELLKKYPKLQEIKDGWTKITCEEYRAPSDVEYLNGLLVTLLGYWRLKKDSGLNWIGINNEHINEVRDDGSIDSNINIIMGGWNY